LPAGVPKEQLVARLRSEGNPRLADMLSAMHVVPGQGIDMAALTRILLLCLAVGVGASIFGLFQGRLVTLVVQRLVFRLRGQVEAKLSRLPLSYFDQRQRGEVLSRATNDTDNIAQTLQQTMSQMLTSMLTIVGVLVMMFWISPLLAVIALVTVPVSIVVAAKVGKRAQPQFVRQWATTGRLNGHIEEMYTGHSVVKSFGRQREAVAQFHEHNDKLYASGLPGAVHVRHHPAGHVLHRQHQLCAGGGRRRAAGRQWRHLPGRRAGLHPVLAPVHPADHGGGQHGQPAPVRCGLGERVFALLDADEQEPDPVPARRPETVRGEVAFEHVSFSYDPDRPLIEDLSLSARPGQTVAIVGPTGAGKTTLVNLLMRFYEVTAGRITLDGVDIATMSRAELRENIGMVLQDTWLFGGTIAENIAYGADDPTREQVIAAAQAAHADRFIRTLPDGYDTVIDEEGSGRQRGREAAHHDRPGVPVGAGHPGAGRGDELGRHPHRGADPAGHELAAVGPDVASSSRTASPPSGTRTRSW
jgi:ATP-binding cassette subfamily B protein